MLAGCCQFVTLSLRHHPAAVPPPSDELLRLSGAALGLLACGGALDAAAGLLRAPIAPPLWGGHCPEEDKCNHLFDPLCWPW